MAKLEFQLCPEGTIGGLTYIEPYHTGTLKKWLDITRVSSDRYYKIIHNGKVIITTFKVVKKLLDTREHVPNKQEAKLKRQQRHGHNH